MWFPPRHLVMFIFSYRETDRTAAALRSCSAVGPICQSKIFCRNEVLTHLVHHCSLSLSLHGSVSNRTVRRPSWLWSQVQSGRRLSDWSVKRTFNASFINHGKHGARNIKWSFFRVLLTEAYMSSFLQIYMHDREDIAETNLKPALLEGKDDSALWLTSNSLILIISFLILTIISFFINVRLWCCRVHDVSALSTQTAFLEAQVVTFTRHRNRLAVVREQKAKARLDMLGEWWDM